MLIYHHSMNKIILFVKCLFTSCIIFAGGMGASSENSRSWSIGGKALYLQPTWDYLNLPMYTFDNVTDYFPAVNTHWNWGFMLEGEYNLDKNTDLNINWYHINASNTTEVTGSSKSSIVNIITPGPTIVTTKPTWNAANIEIGRRVDYGQNFTVRYYGGVEYVNLNFERTISSTPILPTLPSQITYRSYGYNGFGPRPGIDATLTFVDKFSVYMKGATGIYAGTSKFSYNPTNTPFVRRIRTGSSMTIVPELEAKLGATYNKSIAGGQLTLDAGWLWINYFNAIMDADDDKVHVADFGFQGPYVGLKWVGNII